MRACQIQSAGACWLRASLRTAPSSRLSCGALALTCLGITLLLPLRNTPTSYCSPFEERSTSTTVTLRSRRRGDGNLLDLQSALDACPSPIPFPLPIVVEHFGPVCWLHGTSVRRK